ncbi:MAG TPA: cobalamin B12-binding domain-containing protein [Longimicrobiales bacterium]|nr:cobalamin B12-binding domain-containing protein [Longimicrobiales bacterium]
MVEGELLPRLLLTHNAGPVPPSFIARAESSMEHPAFDEFLGLVREDDPDEKVRAFLVDAVERGDTVECVLAELLAPVARRMGELWEEDECDFIEVTVVCNRLQRAIRRLASQFRYGTSGDEVRVLVTGLPHAQHTLGCLMVAEMLSNAGCDVALGEPFVPGIDPYGYDVIALSVARTEEAAAAEMMVRRLRDQAPQASIIVGGAAFREDPALIRVIGADGWAEDAASAQGLIQEMVGHLSRPVARRA